ncbi:hypothetical protein NQ317_003791 [Molorchus minor]|uniref:Cytochrome P450 n=1 Tax=Molorchus minor TaxID=1323400 RepID=A0ABQ9JTU2_9CUCU|nr:hypothetical protein NQ317_003791 [Molorchus minor]
MLSIDYYKEKKVVKELHDVTYSVIDARRKELKKNRSDDKESTIDGMPLSKEDIREEVDTFMFGGHDTASSAISFTLYLLSKNQDAQRFVYDVLEQLWQGKHNTNLVKEPATFSGKIIPAGTDMSIFTYGAHHDPKNFPDPEKFDPLRFMNCTGTMPYSYIPFGAGPRDCIGKIIPAGTDMSIFTYGAHHDPKNFPDPEKFDPLRFMNSTGTMPYSYIPFSAGPRDCIGKKFAALEVKSCVSKILRNFELKPASPEHELDLVSLIVLKSRNGVRMKLVKRKW